MRYIVVTLIALNCIFLYFNLNGERAPEARRKLSQPLNAVASIQLLREIGNSRQQQMEQVVNNPMRLVQVKEVNCKAMGPFSSVTMGQSILERLISMEFPVQMRALDRILDEYHYRVLIPPAASLEAAFRQLRELQSLGIDSYVVTQGSDSLGISMGVYSTATTAEEVKQKLESDGYRTRIKRVTRLEREYWIFSLGDRDLDIGKQVMSSIQLDYPGVRYELQNCPGEIGNPED